MEKKLPKLVVLQTVPGSLNTGASWTYYIARELDRQHCRHVESGGKGHPPTRSMILRRLNALASDGLLRRDDVPDGFYGFKWTLTDEGRAALSRAVEG